ncbi:MAG: YidC/Oxa1 family membrane protein insertase [Planctomycetota bacterium]
MQRLPFVVVSLLAAAANAQGDPQFVREFGRDGERGSYRVKFDDRGAGVVFVQTMDHYVDADTRGSAEHGPDDWMLLAWSDGDFAFRLGQRGEGPFAQSLWTAAWTREELASGDVRFWIDSEDGGLRLSKTFRHRPDQRELALELALENRGVGGAVAGALPLTLTGPALVNRAEVSLFGTAAWSIAQIAGGEPVHAGPAADGRAADLLTTGGQPLSFAGTTNRFFGGFLYPLDEAAAVAVQAIRAESWPPVEYPDPPLKAHSMPRALFDLNLPLPAAGQTSSLTFGVYLGPKSFRVFEEQPAHARFLPIMDVDLEPPCCGGIVVPGGRFMATMELKLLAFFHDYVGSWGIAIMLLTLLVRGLLAPLNFRMQKSMREYGKRMAVVKPKLDKLKEQYKDDPKAHQQAMIQFQREHKIMPPLGGCLPIFLTMPIYIGLFTALRTAYELRHEGFLFIHDLSGPDALFDLGFWPHHFNILPLLWIALMAIQMSRQPLPTDPQQRQMQQIMRYMPILFGVMLYNYAAGLMVYMVTSMLWTFVESAVTKRILGPIDPNAAGMAPTPMM